MPRPASSEALRTSAISRALLTTAKLVEDWIEVTNLGRAAGETRHELLLARKPSVERVVEDGAVTGPKLAAALRVPFRRLELGVDRLDTWTLRRTATTPSAAPARRADGPVVLRHRRRREHAVRARELLHQLRIVGRQHLAFGGFERGVARRQIQRHLARAPVEDDVAARRLDAGEVIEVVVLAGQLVAVGHRHALHHGDCLIADAIEHAVPARAKLLRRKVRLIVLGGGRRQAHSDANRGEQQAFHGELPAGEYRGESPFTRSRVRLFDLALQPTIRRPKNGKWGSHTMRGLEKFYIRSATSGSIRDARSAGTRQAMTTIAHSTSATATYVIGFSTLTPTNAA